MVSFLGLKLIHSSPYYIQGNGHVENVHYFLKTCIHKYVSSQLVCDDIAHIAFGAYNNY